MDAHLSSIPAPSEDETTNITIGPPGVAIGNGAEDMLCFHAVGETLIPKLMKWDQTLGSFEPV